MISLLTVLALVLACSDPAIRAESVCQQYPDGQDVMRLAGDGRTLCFRSVVPVGIAARFEFPQPVDLAVAIQGNGIQLRIDGFEIGTETATVLGGGEYKLTISAADGTAPRKLLVFRKTISLQEGAKFRQAENLATETKEKKTESGIRESLKRWQELREPSATARTELKLGEYWDGEQKYDAAREAFENAALLCQQLNDLRCRTEAVNNSGLESQRLADFDSARNSLEDAARGWGLLKIPKLEAITFSNLGLLYGMVHEYQQALSFDQQAADIFKQFDRAALAKVLIDFGLCYQAMAEYDKAKGYFERALRIESSIRGSDSDSMLAEINLGRTLLSMGYASAAAARLSRVKAEAERHADRSALAAASTNLAQAYLSRGLASSAKPLLENALLLHQALKDRRFIAADQHCLGLVALQQGKTGEAKLRFLEAASLRSKDNLRIEAGDSFYELARLELLAGNLSSARDLAGKSLDLTERVRLNIPSPALRASFSARRRKVIDLLIGIETFHRDPDSSKRSLLIAEQGQGRAILDVLAESSLLTPPPSELQEKKTTLDRQIGMISSEMLSASDKRLSVLRSKAGMLIAERDNVDAEVRESQPERILGHPLNDIERFRRETLPRNTALLEFHIGEHESVLWLVTFDSVEMFSVAAQRTIDRHSREFMRLLSSVLDRKRSPELQSRFAIATQRLSSDLLGVIQGKKLPETLILVADGTLHLVAFEALTIPGTSKPIGLMHNLVRVPSAGYLEAGREVRALSEFPKAFLGVVDPVFSKADQRLGSFATADSAKSQLPRLPFTFEVDTVNRLVSPSKVSIYRDFRATRRALEELDLESYAILHLSTHAIIDDIEPELSRVALSLVNSRGRAIDGYVHPAQFAAWRLNGSAVVLSACETALGKQVSGEGLWGLTASLFEAGASQLILTLLPVDAEGSSEFFSRVYQKVYGQNPVSMERALTRARKAFAASPRWSDPYYWAPFVVVGRPTGRV